MTVLKPFVLIACVAFVAGFMGYLALAELTLPVTTMAAAPQGSWSSTTSAPTPAADDWNAGKTI